MYIIKIHEVNLNTHQRTMYPRRSQPAACSMPSPHQQNTIFVESETESESETDPESKSDPESEIFFESETESDTRITDPESNPDNAYSGVIENQLGLPEYQHGIIGSSPPPVDANVNCNKLNNEREFFSQRKVCKN
jgi:hypothetical protein